MKVTVPLCFSPIIVDHTRSAYVIARGSRTATLTVSECLCSRLSSMIPGANLDGYLVREDDTLSVTSDCPSPWIDEINDWIATNQIEFKDWTEERLTEDDAAHLLGVVSRLEQIVEVLRSQCHAGTSADELRERARQLSASAGDLLRELPSS